MYHSKSLASNRRTKNNQAIKLADCNKPIYEPQNCVNKFNQQFTSHISFVRKIKKKQPLNETNTSTREVKFAIKTSKKSKILGPDNIAPIHLHHLGPLGLNYVTKVLNLSNSSRIIPHIWKVGEVIFFAIIQQFCSGI